ncbi:MAG: hypothetical protein ABI700_25370 [Chloroflexota bacterium]
MKEVPSERSAEQRVLSKSEKRKRKDLTQRRKEGKAQRDGQWIWTEFCNQAMMEGLRAYPTEGIETWLT